MKRNVIIAVLLSLVLALTACGGKGGGNTPTKGGSSKSTPTKSASKGGTENDGDSSPTDSGKSPEPTKSTAAQKIQQAKNFSEGLAFINYIKESGYVCIDTSGKVVFDLNGGPYEDLNPLTPFMGGYAILYQVAQKSSNPSETVVIDRQGKPVFALADDGYNDVYRYDTLGLGRIIVSRNEDTFDRSGTFYYVVDINTGMVEEMNLEGIELGSDASDIKKPLGEYISDGYYVYHTSYDLLGYNPNGKGDEVHYSDKIGLYNIVQNKVVYSNTIAANDMRDGIGDANAKSYMQVDGGFVVYTTGKGKLIRLTLNDFTAHLISETVSYYAGSNLFRDGHIIVYDDTETKETLIYNADTDILKPFVPKVSYDFQKVSASDNRLLVTMKNDVKSTYFTVLDFDGNELFSPLKYGESSTYLAKDILIYKDADGVFHVWRLSDMQEVLTLEAGYSLRFVEVEDELIWFSSDSNGNAVQSCYTFDGREMIQYINLSPDFKQPLSDGLRVALDGAAQSICYIDANGNVLDINR